MLAARSSAPVGGGEAGRFSQPLALAIGNTRQPMRTVNGRSGREDGNTGAVLRPRPRSDREDGNSGAECLRTMPTVAAADPAAAKGLQASRAVARRLAGKSGRCEGTCTCRNQTPSTTQPDLRSLAQTVSFVRAVREPPLRTNGASMTAKMTIMEAGASDTGFPSWSLGTSEGLRPSNPRGERHLMKGRSNPSRQKPALPA